MRPKPRGPTPPLHVIFLGREAEQIRAMAEKIGMPAETLVRVSALNCTDLKALDEARKMFAPKTINKIVELGARSAGRIMKNIETRAGLKLVKGGKK